MSRLSTLIALLISATLFLLPASGLGFSFSEYEAAEQAEELESVSAPVAELHCPSSIKSSRIATMIGERHRDNRRASWGIGGFFLHFADKGWDERFGTKQSVYGALVENLNSGFLKLGLHPLTSQQIQDQIAQAEQEAVLNDDIEAALAAAGKLQADYLLKGIITSHSQTNKIVDVDEIFLTIAVRLVDKKGRELSNVLVKQTVFSDADIPSTIHQLVQKNADHIAYTLFKDICGGEKTQ